MFVTFSLIAAAGSPSRIEGGIVSCPALLGAWHKKLAVPACVEAAPLTWTSPFGKPPLQLSVEPSERVMDASTPVFVR